MAILAIKYRGAEYMGLKMVISGERQNHSSPLSLQGYAGVINGTFN